MHDFKPHEARRKRGAHYNAGGYGRRETGRLMTLAACPITLRFQMLMPRTQP
jgi:hypothetical protein